MTIDTQIIATSGTKELAKNISQILNLPIQQLDSDHFPNQELKIRLKPVTGTAILIGSFASPVNTRIIEYILAADALKRLGCRTIIGVISYLAYSKQDKVFLEGEPLSAKAIAAIIQTAPLTRLYTVDLHNPSIAGYFDIPVTNLSAVDTLAKSIDHPETNSVVVSPDAGSVKNASRFAEKIGLNLAFAAKQRNLHTGEVTFGNLSQSVNNKTVYVYDDMIATGNTLIELAEFLRLSGAKHIHVYCTHHLYLKSVQDLIDASPITSLTVTNSIEKPHTINSKKLANIDISPVIAHQLALKESLS